MIIKKISKRDLAELIGILLGDGYIDPKSKRIKISFNSKDDKEYIGYVKNILDKFGINIIFKQRTTENTAELYVFNKKFTKFLTCEVGLEFSPKWNRAKIPIKFLSDKSDLKVLRGYFDTDGCLVRTNNHGNLYPRLEMKISPAPMQNQFINILKKYNFSYGVYQIGRGKVRIQLNGKIQLKKWVDLIGFGNIKHERKSKTFF